MRRRRGPPPALSFLSRSSTTVLSKTRCVQYTFIHPFWPQEEKNPAKPFVSAPVSDSERSVCQTVDADWRFVWRQGSCHPGALQHSSQVTPTTSYTKTSYLQHIPFPADIGTTEALGVLHLHSRLFSFSQPQSSDSL